MSAPLVADKEELTCKLPLLQIKSNLHECSPSFKYRGFYTSAPLVADIEDLT